MLEFNDYLKFFELLLIKVKYNWFGFFIVLMFQKITTEHLFKIFWYPTFWKNWNFSLLLIFFSKKNKSELQKKNVYFQNKCKTK